MKVIGKVIIIISILLLFLGMLFFGYLIHARLQGNEYQFKIDAMLYAATIANQGKLTAEPDQAVTATYQGKTMVIHPDNYKQLSFYLREDSAMPLFGDVHKADALRITFCGLDTLWAEPVGGSVDQVLIRLETGGKVFRMHTRGGNAWKNLLRCCMEGTYLGDNLQIEPN